VNKIEKTISKQSALLEEHTNFMIKIKESVDDMKTEAKFIIANKDKESNAYAREMNRMQVLDRVRQQVVSNTLEASVSQTMEELKRSRTIVH
jgi:hypothetical protein